MTTLACLTLAASFVLPAADLDSRVDAYLAPLASEKRFSGVVLLANAEGPVVQKAYGLANVETGAANTMETPFRLASITKTFTAAAVLQLIDKGKLRLDDPLSRHLPGVPAAWSGITIRHLLCHTSGIPDISRAPDYGQYDAPDRIARVLRSFEGRALESKPGERFRYSNSGYVVLGWVIERVSGKSYEAYLAGTVFRAAGMKNSGLERPGTAGGRAAGYRPGGKPVPPGDLRGASSAGGLYATAGDLYRAIRALERGRLVSAESWRIMRQPHAPWDVPLPMRGDTTHYGFGLMIGKRHGRDYVAHGGDIDGFSTFFVWFPDERAGVVVLANIEKVPIAAIARGLTAILFGEQPGPIPREKVPVEIDPAKLEGIAGRYEVQPGYVITITIEGGRAIIRGPNEPRVELLPLSDNEFFVRESGAEFQVTRGADGRIDRLMLRYQGKTVPLQRLE